jgi:hypothetical protein
MTLVRPLDSTVERVAPSAVAWIDERRALIAGLAEDGVVSTCHVERGDLPEERFLASVVRVIGDRERVVILGPGDMRLALEREYVTIYRRPDRLVDVEPAAPLGEGDLIARVRALAS